jgi:hypothetical protein
MVQVWARCSVVVVRGATKSRPAPGRATPQRARPSSGEVVERWMPGAAAGTGRRRWAGTVRVQRRQCRFAVVKQLPSAAGGRRHVRAGRRCEHRFKGALSLHSVVRATMSECQCVRPEACTNPQWMWGLISFGSSSMARCRGATVVHGGREVPCRVGRNGGVGVGVGGGRRVRPRCSRSDRSVGVGGSAGSDQPPVAAGRSGRRRCGVEECPRSTGRGAGRL